VPEEAGGFLTWEANAEPDLAGYRIFRGDTEQGPFALVVDAIHATNAIFDPAFRSGAYYAVSAVDDSANESPRSAPYRVP
jgi:hypothetical protein